MRALLEVELYTCFVLNRLSDHFSSKIMQCHNYVDKKIVFYSKDGPDRGGLVTNVKTISNAKMDLKKSMSKFLFLNVNFFIFNVKIKCVKNSMLDT